MSEYICFFPFYSPDCDNEGLAADDMRILVGPEDIPLHWEACPGAFSTIAAAIDACRQSRGLRAYWQIGLLTRHFVSASRRIVLPFGKQRRANGDEDFPEHTYDICTCLEALKLVPFLLNGPSEWWTIAHHLGTEKFAQEWINLISCVPAGAATPDGMQWIHVKDIQWRDFREPIMREIECLRIVQEKFNIEVPCDAEDI